MKTKSIKDKIQELDNALNALKNANNHYHKGKDKSYLLNIMAILRSLVALGGKSMHPLLINLSKELNIPLELYSSPPPPILKSHKLVGSYQSGKTWTTIKGKGFKKYILEDWLNTSIYFTETSKQYKTRNQIIKDIANNMGGSHYSNKIPHIVDTLKRTLIGNDSYTIDGIEMVLIDFAPLVYWLGKRLLLRYQIKELNRISIITLDHKKKKQLELDNKIKKMDEYFHKQNISNANFTLQLFE